MTKKYLILLLTLFVSIAALQAQIYDEQGQYVDTIFHDHINRQADDFVKVSLVVAEPGGALYSIFGHACLHLVCDTFGLDYVYSYESEDASSKIAKYFAGKLHMGLSSRPLEKYIAEWDKDRRGIKEYELLLSPSEKQELWRILDEQVNKGMYLPYDFEKRGCVTSCIKFVKQSIGNNEIKYNLNKNTNKTRREIGWNFAHKDYPWSSWLLMTIIGTEYDKPMSYEDNLFIPSDLVDAWYCATINDHCLLGEEKVILTKSSEYKRTLITPNIVAVILLFLVIFGWLVKVSWFDYLVLFITSLLGVGLCYLVICSSLPCTDWNWLLIPFNILPIVFWKWRKYWGIYYAILIVIWVTAILFVPQVLVDPANIVLALTFSIVLFKQWWFWKIQH